jgi:hypothetical protein
MTEQQINARKIALDIVHWPYGANAGSDVVKTRLALLDWAEARKVKLSRADPCLRWIKTGKSYYDGGHLYHPWMDHLTAWTRNGKPAILLAQPYHLCPDDLRHLASLEASGLDISIHGRGWYGYGTVCIEITAEAP